MSKAAAVWKKVPGVRVGQVTSDRRDKTRTVVVMSLRRAPKYGKIVRYRSTFQAHDAENAARQGDTVAIAPCRRISKSKSWRIVHVIDRSHDTEEAEAKA